jgi:hypothetical protein
MGASLSYQAGEFLQQARSRMGLQVVRQ